MLGSGSAPGSRSGTRSGSGTRSRVGHGEAAALEHHEDRFGERLGAAGGAEPGWVRPIEKGGAVGVRGRERYLVYEVISSDAKRVRS